MICTRTPTESAARVRELVACVRLYDEELADKLLRELARTVWPEATTDPIVAAAIALRQAAGQTGAGQDINLFGDVQAALVRCVPLDQVLDDVRLRAMTEPNRRLVHIQMNVDPVLLGEAVRRHLSDE